MTIDELREVLEILVDEGHGEEEIKILQQPSYPLESPIVDVGWVTDMFYIAAGEACDYGPRYAEIEIQI